MAKQKRLWAKEVELEKGELSKHGWREKNKASTRRKALMLSVSEDGYDTTIRRLGYVINVSKDKGTVKKMKADRAWLQKKRAKALQTGRGILAKPSGRLKPQRTISR